MKDLKNITLFTFKEIWANKTFLILFSVYNVILIALAAFSVYAFKNAPIEVKNYSGLLQLQTQITSSVASIFILISIFSTSSLSVSYLPKGLIDLYLSKPISRPAFIYSRFFAVALFIFLNFVYITLFIWIFTSSLLGIWAINIFWLPLFYTFAFITILALIFLCGILTRNSTLGIILSYLILMFQPVLAGLHSADKLFPGSPFLKGLINTLYYILPKVNELLVTIPKTLVLGGFIESYQPFITSLLFATAAFGVSVYLFNKKDF